MCIGYGENGIFYGPPCGNVKCFFTKQIRYVRSGRRIWCARPTKHRVGYLLTTSSQTILPIDPRYITCRSCQR